MGRKPHRIISLRNYMNEKIKEYLWSSLTTFVAAFLLAVAPMIGGAAMDQAVWLAIFMAGGRAGVKALIQYFMSGNIGEILGAKGRV